MVVKSLISSSPLEHKVQHSNELAFWQEGKKVGMRSQVFAFASMYTTRFMSEFVYPRFRHSFPGANFPKQAVGSSKFKECKLRETKGGGKQETQGRSWKELQ